MKASQHVHEALRLKALKDLNVLDTPPDIQLDAITKATQEYFGCKICLVSLIAEDRQWFKSRQCLDVSETPRNISFCTYAIAEEEYLIVPNALEDNRFSNNELVQGAPFIRAYAGAILRSLDGYELGTLCVIHDSPRAFSAEDIDKLREFAKLAEAVLNKNIVEDI
ncbi:GAF domain-containing protein [Alteromonas sp. CI.11.F.A3]|uniref:GAF domain-containing protein n=1 Tax=Alteromonas sp. CI.11.F.A3 TaxID=3079555 RepID=UPI002943EF2D|nr:GAF domain-containing protein [Alteromonas sp. CI.11.F.A3]WOI36409.1 GAF domain-containing protein [Alteromonas sp. CI.11.F.A3]